MDKCSVIIIFSKQEAGQEIVYSFDVRTLHLGSYLNLVRFSKMVRIRPNNEILTFSLNAEDLTKLSVAQK